MSQCDECIYSWICPSPGGNTEKCEQYETLSNYDLIMRMTPEELSVWLAGMVGVVPFEGAGCDHEKWLKWLLQEGEI